jgi:hypothetical protein
MCGTKSVIHSNKTKVVVEFQYDVEAKQITRSIAVIISSRLN